MADFPGWKIGFPVYREEIGGTVAVIDRDIAKGTGFLPPDDFAHRWIVLHVSDSRRSKKGLSRATLREAKLLALQLSQDEHEIKLRSLTDGRISDPLPVPTQKADKGKKAKESKTGGKPRPRARAKETPPPSPPEEPEKHPLGAVPEVQFTQSELNHLVQIHLAQIALEKVRRVLDESLDATSIIWVDKVIPDPDNPEKVKVIKTTEEIPDHKTRQSGAKIYLEYLVGRPVERTEVIERKQVDYSEIEKRLEGSQLYRDELRKMLDEMDDRARGGKV